MIHGLADRLARREQQNDVVVLHTASYGDARCKVQHIYPRPTLYNALRAPDESRGQPLREQDEGDVALDIREGTLWHSGSLAWHYGRCPEIVVWHRPTLRDVAKRGMAHIAWLAFNRLPAWLTAEIVDSLR